MIAAEVEAAVVQEDLGHRTDGPPVVPHDAFAAHGTDGPNGMPGPASEPVRALSAGRPDIAEQLLTPWQVLFGAGPRLEVFSHGTPGTGPGPPPAGRPLCTTDPRADASPVKDVSPRAAVAGRALAVTAAKDSSSPSTPGSRRARADQGHSSPWKAPGTG
ncbi:hypothetical protein ACIP93_24295 [Streptomyces sp. NPDC088745]|uniref:hypothetical protein n=1 Tax=Streptomyces sp. NPDC088745 TaxID=3365884 RepID=UPI003820C320